MFYSLFFGYIICNETLCNKLGKTAKIIFFTSDEELLYIGCFRLLGNFATDHLSVSVRPRQSC